MMPDGSVVHVRMPRISQQPEATPMASERPRSPALHSTQASLKPVCGPVSQTPTCHIREFAAAFRVRVVRKPIEVPPDLGCRCSSTCSRPGKIAAIRPISLPAASIPPARRARARGPLHPPRQAMKSRRVLRDQLPGSPGLPLHPSRRREQPAEVSVPGPALNSRVTRGARSSDPESSSPKAPRPGAPGGASAP